MTIQEIATWVAQLNVQEILSQMTVIQKNQIKVEFLILSSYAVVFLLNKSASRAYAFLAFLMCVFIEYTPVSLIPSAVQYHALFAIIYLSVTYKVKPVKAKVACCLLGSFQIIMAWDSYINAQIETFIWLHYEVIVCLLHALIIGSFLERDAERIKRHLERFASFVRHLFGYSCNRLCLWYY